jgi:integrase
MARLTDPGGVTEMQGHIHKRVHKTSDGRQTVNWYVVLDLGRGTDGKRRQKWHGGFRTRKDAEVAPSKLITSLNAGTYVEATSMTLEEWVRASWTPTMKSQDKPSTFDSYRRNLELHVLPQLGRFQLRTLTAPMLNKLYADLLSEGNLNRAGGLSAKSVRYIHTIIHKALADAVDADLLVQNVATKAKPPQPRAVTSTELRSWDPRELSEFLDLVSGHRLEAAWRLAAMTGMRRGEVLGLRWRDLDLGSARISVRQALVSVAYTVIATTPKAHRPRVIDLDPETVDQLRRHRNHQITEKAMWAESYQDNDLVFCKEDGTSLHPHTFSQSFERIVDKSGLPRIRLHDLRHTHATIALKAGVPVKVISERLGHENAAFTLKQYAHVIPGMQAEAAATIARVLNGTQPL